MLYEVITNGWYSFRIRRVSGVYLFMGDPDNRMDRSLLEAHHAQSNIPIEKHSTYWTQDRSLQVYSSWSDTVKLSEIEMKSNEIPNWNQYGTGLGFVPW